MIQAMFFVIIGVIGWVFIAYPLLLLTLNKMLKVHAVQRPNTEPTVSLIIAAYNEERVIGRKIENTLKLDYPKEKLEVIVFSDASSDRTDEIVKSYEMKGVKLVRIEGRKGKVFCKNEVAKMANGEILVFSDANSMYEPSAIKELVKHFSDPAVGCVGGELRYKYEEQVMGEGLYWRYEQWIKRMEGNLGNLTTVNGAIYAIKKDVFEPLPVDVPDDFGITILVRAKGFKVVHEPNAVAWEETAPNVKAEMKRRVRMVAQASYCLFRKPQFRRLLNPLKYGFLAVQLWSHKVLRWFTGLFLVTALLLNAFLVGENVLFTVSLWGQVLFYILAASGIVQEYWIGKKSPKLVHVISYFVLSCYAMLHGLWKGLRGKTFIIWTPAR